MAELRVGIPEARIVHLAARIEGEEQVRVAVLERGFDQLAGDGQPVRRWIARARQARDRPDVLSLDNALKILASKALLVA